MKLSSLFKPTATRGLAWVASIAAAAFALQADTARASIAYGSINNFDTVNDTGHECHGFEIEIEDCHSTDVTYTYDYNHYGTCHVTEDDTVPGHPKCILRWESKKNADGTWAAYTAIPAGPITPTQGHSFTNPAVNFGGEHFGVGYRAAVGVVSYKWLIDNGAGVLVNGGAVQVSTPSFTYYPGVGGGAAQMQAVIAPPPPPAPEPREFGEAVWVKEIRTTAHKAGKVKLRDLVSEDPTDPAGKNWKNGEPDEVEVEWQILQKDYGVADGGVNNEVPAAAEALPNGNEVITRRYEFYKYVGPLDLGTGEAMADVVAADHLHGVGTATINGLLVDLSTVVIVGDFTGAQMAGADAVALVGLIDHVSEGRINTVYVARTVVVGGALPFLATRTGALPAGMTFNAVTGVLAGTPAASGQFTFKLTASDGVNPDVSKNYTLRIAAVGEVLPPTSLLDTTAAPVGTGTTTGDGAFAPGANVTVQAAVAAGFHFVSWTDNGKVGSNSLSYTFVIDVSHSLIAHFAVIVPLRTIAVSAAPVAGGTVSGGGIFAAGDPATVVATANPGYVFARWQEGSVTVSNSASYTFTVGASRTLVAKFNQAFVITAAASPAVGGTTETDSSTYQAGDNAQVKAFPAAGFTFANWTDNGGGVSALATYSFNVTGNRALTANFLSATDLTVTTNSAPAAGGATLGEGVDVVGDIVAVSAVPSAGYGFVSWTEGGVVVSPVADFTFIADVSHALVAHFAAPAAIDVSASSDAGGAVGGAASYGLAASATVIAAPNDGYTFTNWTDGGAVVSTAPIYTFTVTAARALVANFQPFPEVETTAGAPGSGVLVLSWPDMDHASVLQESTDLANWVGSPRPAAVVGSRKNVPASTAGAHRFFRLAHP